jgi:glutathione synthase/RimK-type ligase-like ATP-grasp enzyme
MSEPTEPPHPPSTPGSSPPARAADPGKGEESSSSDTAQDATPPSAGEPAGARTAAPSPTPSSCLLVADSSRALAALGPLPKCAAHDYLTGRAEVSATGVAVLNLCRSYDYLSNGYYVSLLADARGQRVLPTLEQIEELSHPFAYMRTLRENGVRTIDFQIVGRARRPLPEVIVPGLKPGTTSASEGTPPAVELQPKTSGGDEARYAETEIQYAEIKCVLGRTNDPRFRKIASGVFRALQFPLLSVRLYRDDTGWKVGQVAPARVDALTPEELQLLETGLPRLWKGDAGLPDDSSVRLRIACLWDENDPFAASDEEALRSFKRAAERRGALFEIIDAKSLARLAEYDALFIRTVTAVDHYAFRFAQTAESLGMPVIDDTQSILRCSNKVYLHELCLRHGLRTPRTLAASRKTPRTELHALGFPLVIKVPDGSFSAAVRKAADPAELDTRLEELFAQAPLLVVQEYMPTDYDWRVGVLDGRILYVCRYFMARGHWQIARHYGAGRSRSGRVEGVAIDDAPAEVRRLALDVTALIGDGLYGVDIKDGPDGPIIIEVNDNPSIERGYEDTVEGDRLYDTIIESFVRRIEAEARAQVSA